MRWDWKEVDNSDEKLKMAAVESKKGCSPSFPHCPVDLQCLQQKKAKAKNTHISTQWIAWGMSNW